MSEPLYCGDCKHPAHSGPCPVLHFYDRPGGPPGNQQCMCGHPAIESRITFTPCQSRVDLRAQLAACQGEKEVAQAELRSWEYEPNGQLRAKLSNADIQSILDKAKEYMDQRDKLQCEFGKLRLENDRFRILLHDCAHGRVDEDRISAALANQPTEGEKI